MFGFVIADAERLTVEERKIYNAYYCGLCKALKNYGQKERLTLNFDLAFLCMFLSSYFKEEQKITPIKCSLHPIKNRYSCVSKYADYCAAMNILLSYHKLADDAGDEASASARIMKRALDKSYRAAKNKYPEKDAAITEALIKLEKIEKRDEHNPDIPAKVFGELLGSVFDIDSNDEKLYNFGASLGKVIYIMDACVDLKRDIKRMNYNPMVEIRTEKFQQILTVLLRECTDIYDTMNITLNKGIIENILFCGIWYRFRRKNK